MKGSPNLSRIKIRDVVGGGYSEEDLGGGKKMRLVIRDFFQKWGRHDIDHCPRNEKWLKREVPIKEVGTTGFRSCSEKKRSTLGVGSKPI